MPTRSPSALSTALCLVLRANSYGDNDFILTLFDRERGLETARAHGAKSLKSSIRAACQPFCVAEFEFYVRGGRLSVKAASVRTEFYRLQENYTAYVCGCIILELTERVLRYAPEYEEMFRLTVGSLSVLDGADASPKAVLLFFLLRLIHLLGVFPVLTACASCGEPIPRPELWSALEGGTVCPSCAASQPVQAVRPAVLACLRHYGRGQLRDLAEDLTPAGDVDDACRLLLNYLKVQYDMYLRAARMLPREGA